MTSLERMLRRARRRATADLAIHRAGWGLVASLGAGVLLLLVDRIAGVEIPLAVYGGLLAVGFVGGLIHAALSRPNDRTLAIRLDSWSIARACQRILRSTLILPRL